MTTIADVERLARNHLVEPVPKFWSSQELTDIIIAGIRDLWRDIVNLKQEHFLKINDGVVFKAGDDRLTGIPEDVHKIYLIEPLDNSNASANEGLQFMPLDYNHRLAQLARSRDAISPLNDTIYYSPTGMGGPSGVTTIYAAPKVSADVKISFAYVPTLDDLDSSDEVPVPGESTNALVAWTVAYARAKETEERSPDPGWLSTYATEKQHILQALGLRQYQEPIYVDASFQEYW